MKVLSITAFVFTSVQALVNATNAIDPDECQNDDISTATRLEQPLTCSPRPSTSSVVVTVTSDITITTCLPKDHSTTRLTTNCSTICETAEGETQTTVVSLGAPTKSQSSVPTTAPVTTHTTIYTTHYSYLCPTGWTQSKYTITETCASETPVWPERTLGYMPPGFTRTVNVCESCPNGPITATVTVPCSSTEAADRIGSPNDQVYSTVSKEQTNVVHNDDDSDDGNAAPPTSTQGQPLQTSSISQNTTGIVLANAASRSITRLMLAFLTFALTAIWACLW
ncbi:hypothetical protein BU16DRAFT_578835 [Lophium mytilinum]|uniref:Uncharacterized protein n=1 Tax=Lophium mytilinum TaxID=390894 RepID=A0A6A6R3B6_9PEZI|nr:hypothetical protein BU16DRAFT_578835 [Lophium mytilinum]